MQNHRHNNPEANTPAVHGEMSHVALGQRLELNWKSRLEELVTKVEQQRVST